MALKLIQVARNFNVGLHTIVEALRSNGFSDVEEKPTFEITDEMITVLNKEFQKDLVIKQEAEKLLRPTQKKETITLPPLGGIGGSVLGKPGATSALPDLRSSTTSTKPEEAAKPEKKPALELPKRELPQLRVVGKVDLDPIKPVSVPKKQTTEPGEDKKDGQQTDPKTQPASSAASAQKESESSPSAIPATPNTESDAHTEPELLRAETPTLRGLKILGKVDTGKFKEEPGGGGNPRTRERDRRHDSRSGGQQNAGNDRRRYEQSAPGGVQFEGNTAQGGSSNTQAEGQRRKRTRKKVTQPITAEAIQKSLTGLNPDSSKYGNRRGQQQGQGGGAQHRAAQPPREISQKEIEEKIKQTMARLDAGASRKRQKIRRDKRELMREKQELADANMQESSNILQVTEFISVSDLANLIDKRPADIIKMCMSLGIFVSINQRLDAEIIEVVASEFGYEVKFITAEEQVEVEEEEVDRPEDLRPRQPIVTVMGHVDHGKTSLLDYIRKANVAEGEAGGITQHIGAYEVQVYPDDPHSKITFLDTPGHEAFTAMRARGAKVTDIAIIVVAADDAIMPQTREAISHAQAANVPIIFAINKIDKPGADPDRIKNELAQMNLLVEEWGGKIQSQDISAKKGTNIDKLLEKVLLEAELLELKANPHRRAYGTVLEASLDKGRGYVCKILVENGTLHEGDPIICGEYAGKVKALFNERGQRVSFAGPAQPVLVLGLSGAPQAGEKIKETATEAEAKEIALKRAQIIREQATRSTKRISLDEIGRRLALGNFKELKLIVKGDVDGSVEALTDSLIKLTIEKVQVSVIHKGVGQIVDSDIMLASASDAIVIGFQVRPSLTARKLAEKEGVEIKTYSIIYEAIEEIKSAIEGLLEPTKEEEIMGQVEVREIYKVAKVGTIAGCYVQEGKISRSHYVRVIRDGIVIYPANSQNHAEIGSLKRFKEDVKEVKSGLECGLTIKNFNDIKVGDIIESYIVNEIRATL